MKAIALVPGTTTLQLVDRPVPTITAPDEIKLRVLQVGICGTDREEAAGGRADPPVGQTELLIGHEMFGQVVKTGIGGTYVDGRQVKPDALDDHFGEIDVIFEATGVARLEFDLLSTLGDNGVYVLTDIPGGDRPISVDGSALMRQLVLRNQVMVGSVNANRTHFQRVVDDLVKSRTTWGDTVDS